MPGPTPKPLNRSWEATRTGHCWKLYDTPESDARTDPPHEPFSLGSSSPSVVKAMPVSRKELWAWCMYDFANSSFTTLIVTVAYSVYFVQVVAAHLGDGTAERVWFWGYAASMFV